MRKLSIAIVFLSLSFNLPAQNRKEDSLAELISKEKTDTTRVKLMWQLANITKNSNTEKALVFSRQSLFLAERIKYIEGQSKALGMIANIFMNIGNYPKALQYYFEKLKLEEKRDSPRNLASVLMNIGAVYVYQEEYAKALQYYYRSDSVIMKNNLESMKYYDYQNLADVYDRIRLPDSSYHYFNKALTIAQRVRDDDFIGASHDDFMGASLTGLGHSYLKKDSFALSKACYLSAIGYLQKARDNYLLCEAALGLAKLYQKINNKDSATYYAKMSLMIAQNDNFLLRDLEAAKFLTDHFRKLNQIDSAFRYMSYLQVLNDSINSKSRIRELQVMSSNEQLRQIEIEENKKIAQQERIAELQLLLIGIFIPTFFLITLLLSRIKLDVRVVRVLGILSLLFLFEYLTLLIHPFVTRISNHTPVYELLVYVTIAGILIPIHHRIEHWMIDKLVHNKQMLKLTMKTARFKIKNPEQ